MLWAALLLVAAPAAAQDLPVFDAGAGYEVKGVLNDGLVVESDGQAFLCGIDAGPQDAYHVLSRCAPILGAEAAQAASRAVMAALADEATFIGALEKMPSEAFTPAVIDALRDMNCIVDFREGEEAFQKVLAENVARMTGYAGPISAEGIEGIGEIAEDAAEQLVKDGRVLVDRDAGTARLVDCP